MTDPNQKTVPNQQPQPAPKNLQFQDGKNYIELVENSVCINSAPQIESVDVGALVRSVTKYAQAHHE